MDSPDTQWLHLADDDGGITELDAAFPFWDPTDLSFWPSPSPEHPSLQLGLSGAQGAHSPAVYGAAGPSSRSLLVDGQSNGYAMNPEDLGLFGPYTLGPDLAGYAAVDVGDPAAFLEDWSHRQYQGDNGTFDAALSDGLLYTVSDPDWTANVPVASTPDVSEFAAAFPPVSRVLDK